jgi:hypothetical protein
MTEPDCQCGYPPQGPLLRAHHMGHGLVAQSVNVALAGFGQLDDAHD